MINKIGSSVNLVIIIDNKLLMMRRISKKWMDGRLQIPGGHVEQGESPSAAIRREVREELGARLDTTDIKFLAAIQVNEDGSEYVAYQFMLQNPELYIFKIQEIEKCSEIVWVEIRNIPEDIIPIFRTVINECVVEQSPYVEYGYKYQ